MGASPEMGRQADIGLRHIAARGGQLLMRTRRIVGLPGWGKVRSRPVDWTAFKTGTRPFQFLWIITSVDRSEAQAFHVARQTVAGFRPYRISDRSFALWQRLLLWRAPWLLPI